MFTILKFRGANSFQTLTAALTVVASLMITNYTFAEGLLDYGPFPSDPPKKTASGTSPRTAVSIRPSDPQWVRNFRYKNHRIKPGGECEKILVEAAARLGRVLTENEVLDAVQAITVATGELSLEHISSSTVPVATPAVEPLENIGFEANMKVLTMRGEVEIHHIRPGDIVISVTRGTKGQINFVANPVVKLFYNHDADTQLLGGPRAVHMAKNQKFWVQVWASGKFAFTDTEGGFDELRLTSAQKIVYFSHKWGLGPLRPKMIGRGGLSSSGRIPTFSLQLRDSPHNFIVQGVLAKSVEK